MSRTLSRRAAVRRNSRWQSFALLLFGIIFLLLAWLKPLDYHTYPAGVFIFGLAILVAAVINPYRLIMAGFLVTLIGLAVYFSLKPTFAIFKGQGLALFVLAIGIGLLGIALMARRGYISIGAVTPAMIVIVAGIIEFLLAANLTPGGFVPFFLSFWLPGTGSLVLGLIYLFVSVRA
ncbi:MAG TPA: hypothetical protein VFA09_04695 [Ktedonobacteraceae bacterium]|nr:hypothetical protein [Ktedonobacteraceae bacterium]